MNRALVFIFEDGVSESHRYHIMRGAYDFLDLIGLSGEVNIYHDYEVWKFMHGHRSLLSGEEIIDSGVRYLLEDDKSGQLSNIVATPAIYAGLMMSSIGDKLSRWVVPIVVTKKKLYHEHYATFISGAARPGVGLMITTIGRLSLKPKVFAHFLETLMFHELGHVFGLVPPERYFNVLDTGLGQHCSEHCIMYSSWFEGKEYMHMHKRPFCIDCFFYLLLHGKNKISIP
jgi:predicted Zn-dependent protease